MTKDELRAYGKNNSSKSISSNWGKSFKSIKERYDWPLIQLDHNNGLSYSSLMPKYSLSRGAIGQAIKYGVFVPVSKEEQMARSSRKRLGGKLSDEHKKKISVKRKQWLADNPDKHCWITSTGPAHRSVPCELLKSRLQEEGISFEEEFQPMLGDGRFFSIDIYFPQWSLGIEVNGRQHYNTDADSLKEYYQKRHDLIESKGIRLIELKYHKVFCKQFLDEFIESLKTAKSS